MVRAAKEPGKPKGACSSYICFVQACHDEHKKKHPNESVAFKEFSQKCSEKWKAMTPKERCRFDELSAKDKVRYSREMDQWEKMNPGMSKRKRKQDKDPNRPKKALSAFFFFCAQYRGQIQKEHPEFKVADISKALGVMWGERTDRSKYDREALEDKERYARDMELYNKGLPVPKKAAKAVVEEVEEEEEEEELNGEVEEEDDD